MLLLAALFMVTPVQSSDSVQVAQVLQRASSAAVTHTMEHKPRGVAESPTVYVDVALFRKVGGLAGLETGSLSGMPAVFGERGKVASSEEVMACPNERSCNLLGDGLLLQGESITMTGDSAFVVLRVRYTDRRGNTSASGHIQYLVSLRRTDAAWTVAGLKVGTIT